jgi:trans-aconitate methyltransferase/GNAT superfamily N-acetyltransferase
MELVAKLGLRGEERLLDIGSGDWKVTAQIALALPRGSVLGVDQSEEMVRHAQGQFPQDQFSNLAFQLGEASALGFESEFDVVFSNATLHWVKDHRPVLAGIQRAFKFGGLALLQMGGRGNAADVLRAMEAVMRREAWAVFFSDHSDPYGFHGPEEYAEWLTAAGLTARRVELIPRDMTQRGREGLAGWVRTTWMPYAHRVPEEARERFIGEVTDEYLKAHPADPDSKVHVSMVRLEVEARKEEQREGERRGRWRDDAGGEESSMTDAQLRDATPQDAPGMTALIASLTEWFSPDEVETVREVVGPPGVVAASSSGEIVAFLVWEARPDEWEICWIAVARDRHRQGLGRQMLAWMLERARQTGVGRIRVQTIAHTTDYAPYVPSRAFYEASGFVLESIEPKAWPCGDEVIYPANWPEKLDKAVYVLTL